MLPVRAYRWRGGRSGAAVSRSILSKVAPGALLFVLCLLLLLLGSGTWPHTAVPQAAARELISPMEAGPLARPDAPDVLQSGPIVAESKDQIRPAVAYRMEAGEYFVVWEEAYSPTDHDIYSRRVAADGTPTGTALVVVSSIKSESNPAVAYNAVADEYLVVYEYEYAADDHDIYGRRMRADGVPLGDAFVIAGSVAFESNPEIAYSAAGNEYLVVWEHESGLDEFTHNDIYGQRLAADGSDIDDFLILVDGPLDESLPAVAHGDTYLVVWQEKQPGTGEYDIRGLRVGSSGAIAGSEIDISTWEYDQIKPRLALNHRDGLFLVVWEDHHWAWGDARDIYGQRVSTSGSLIGGNLTITGEDAEPRLNPDVSYKAAANEYVVVWEHEVSVTDHDVYYRRVKSDGSRPEPDIPVSQGDAHEKRPVVASDDDWSYLVVWEDERDAQTQGVNLYGQAVLIPALSGYVYEGSIDDESKPLANVTVELYCSNNAGALGNLVASMVTNGQGFYQFVVSGICEYYNIVEVDPPDYVSVGSKTVGGTVVSSNRIQYTYPLVGKTLAGNKFWDVPEGPDDAIPPGNWANFSPTGWVNTPTVTAAVQVEDTESGLRISSAQYAYSNDGGTSWSGWQTAVCSGSDGTTTPQMVTAVDVPFAQGSIQHRIKFRMMDLADNIGESPVYSVNIDTVPPQNPTTLFSATHTPGVWSDLNLVTCQWSGASDDRSGLAGYSYAWDHSANTVPDTMADTSMVVVTSFPLADGDDWYCHVRAVDNAGNGASGAVHYGPFYIDRFAPTSSLSAPATANTPNFSVSWSGTDDGGSGIASYDVQVRDTTTGSGWTTWQNQTTATAATFAGQHGHIYDFRVRARDHAGFVEAWPSAPDATTRVATVDFENFGLEVTQAIQDLNNSVELVAHKRTFVRLHVRSLKNGDHGPVSAQLSATRAGSSLGTISPSNPGGTITVRQNPDREQLDHTFYFDLPTSWLEGTVRLTAEVNHDGRLAETTTANNTRTVQVTFLTTSEMNVLLVDACYTVGTTTYHVRNTDRWALASWLRRAYPIHRLNVWWGVFSPCYASQPSAGQVNKDLKWHKSRQVLGSDEDPYTRYYGMIDDGGGFVRGEGSLPGTVATGPAGAPGSGSWDSDSSYADWYGAHELGHTYNQPHTRGTNPPPCGNCSTNACGPWGTCGCEAGAVVHYTDGRISPTQNTTSANALYGFDIGTLDIYPPDWVDLMSYCDNEWISDYTYESIRARMVSESGAAAAWQRPADTQEHLAVFGFIYTDTNRVELDPFYRVPDSWDLFGREPGPYSIRLLDAGGSTLADYPFTPEYNHVDPGPTCQAGVAAEEVPALIAEYVPWVDGTKRVAIYYGSQQLISRSVSAHAPQVTLTHPNGGELLDGAQITVSWTASDADGDALTYTLEYSVDGGAQWRPLGSGITGSSLVLDAASVPGTEQGLFRILASDGVNTTQDESDGVFTVSGKAPQVRITSPQSGASYLPGQPVALIGEAIDVEDGSPEDAAFSWRSDLDGVLGTGRMLHVTDLSEGTHVVTLTVTDTDGQQRSADVTIHITTSPARDLYLPLVIRGH